MKFFLFFLAFWALGAGPARAAETKVYNAQTFTLENGLPVVVIPLHRAPVVTHMVWLRVGSADETPGQSGKAHFLEHMMFKGTTAAKPGEFSRTVRALGGNDNAFTAYDYTAYFETIAREHLEKMMALDADRLQNLNPPPVDYASEHKVIMEERRERTDNDPSAALMEQMKAVLFINHPYGNPVIGWMHEIENLQWAQLKPFYDQYYAPNNALVVIAGDVTVEDVKPLAEKIYGTWPRRDVPERTWRAVPPLPAPAHLTLRHKDVRQPAFIRLYRAPSARADKTAAFALDVLQDIMDGGAATRLYQALVVRGKLATGVGFSYDGVAWDEGTLTLSATPAPGVTLETLEKALDAELALLVKDGVTDAEIAESKARLKDAAAFARDSLTGPAMVVGRGLISGLTLDDIEYWPRTVDSVLKSDIEKAARQMFDPAAPGYRPPVSGYLLPAEATP